MPNLFFVSDTHFNHSNIILYSRRPFSSIEEMNEKMIANWNAMVKPNDLVFHLGDFAFMPFDNFLKLLRRLNGKKHHILGNHDKMIDKNRNRLLNSRALESIQNYREVKVDGEKLILFHYGQRVWNKSHRGSIHLYGHSHGSLPPHGKSVDVGVDCKEITDEYRPVHLDEVLSYMSKREFAKVDHHGKDDE